MNWQSGRRAEDIAAVLLARRGLKVLARNYRCRGGEIDLICRDGQTLVFVEVRARSSLRFGGAAESITAAKQARILHASRHYLADRGEPVCRFDVVLIDGPASTPEWIRDAFQAD